GFFGAFLREAAGVVREVNTAMRSAFDEPFSGESEPWYEAHPVRAQPVSRTVSLEELAALCDEFSLARRRDDVLGLAAPSLRLTCAAERQAGVVRSHLGGVPDLPPNFVWPSWNGGDLDFLGQVDLAEVAASAPDAFGPPALPASGLLLFFYGLGAAPAGLARDDREGSRVLYLDESRTRELAPASESRLALPHYCLELSWELTLPRSWSIAVEHLDLDGDEATAWDALREGLAQRQGVELEELTPSWQALHRLLGHGEELGSDLELDCELVEAGIEVEEEPLPPPSPPPLHP